MIVKEEIQKLVAQALADGVRDGVFAPEILGQEIKIEYPREAKFGDYATPIAMESARVLRRSPMDIGEKLAPYLRQSPLVGAVEVVKPGFVNIFLSSAFLFDALRDVLRLDADYGRSTREKQRRINIEFVSANPTGPLNIVSARAAAIGDSIATLLECTGDQVEREFYVNDYGNQVALLGASVLARIRELRGEAVVFPEDGYHGEYVKDIARDLLENSGAEIDALPNDEARIDFLARRAVARNVAGQRADLERFKVSFATWFSERTLHEKGEVGAALAKLKDRHTIYDEDGKQVFRSTAYGDDKDRVVVRDDGRPTYLLADIAYHFDKISRGYDLIIDIWGPDHHGYIARLAGAVEALGFDRERFRILIAQQVNLLMDGEAVRMSKRLGRFSTMRELIDEIGVDVSRYFFTMRSLDSHLDFDLALAKKESSENPVFYLQYAHARNCSIFRKAQERGIAYEPQQAHGRHLASPEAESLLKLIVRFPEEVRDAADAYEPHRVAAYLLRLAQAYHRFYTDHQILSDDAERTATYLALADAVRITIRNGLRLLGVSAPEKM